MALTDLKKGILDEAHAKAQSVQEESRAATRGVIEEARKKAGSIVAEAKAAIHAQEVIQRQEANAEAEAAASALLSEALDHSVNAELERFRKVLQRELSANHMPILVKRAVARFQEVAEKSDTVVEVTKKYAPLVKGVAKVVPVKEQGHIVLYTKDKSVRLDGSVESIVDSNVAAIKTELLKHMQA